MALSKRYVDDLFKQIYKGKIGPKNLPQPLYMFVVEELQNNIEPEFIATGSELSEAMQINLNLFASAKVFQQIRETISIIPGDNGKIPFKEFEKKAQAIHDRYNGAWLKTEETTVTLQSQNCMQWQTFESNKENLKYLQYQTSDDDRVSDLCKPLDNVIRRVDDPFWNNHSPMRHYRCRCYLIQIKNGVETPDSLIDKMPEPNAVFKNNIGKTGIVFDKSHPYFDIPKQYIELAKKNFNLPIVK